MLINYNNLCQFIDIKDLSSKKVRWAQNLSCYYFQINYCQGKANETADTLFWYPQQSLEEEEILRAENFKILHRLQLFLGKVSGLLTSHFSPFYHILICRTTVLLQLY